MNAQYENYLRKPTAAAYCAIPVRTFNRWQQLGLIPHYRVGRVVLYRRDELDRALRRFKRAENERVTGVKPQ